MADKNDKVTEFERETAFTEIEEMLELSQQIAHVGSWSLDLRTGSLIWSDEVFRIFGYQPQAFKANYAAFLDAVHPDDRAGVDAAYSESVKSKSSGYEIEHRILRHGTGEIRFVHEKCSHIADSSGSIIRSIGMVQDISDQKRAEEALRESEETLRATLKSIGDAVISTDTKTHVVSMNPVAESLTGWSEQDALGKPLAPVFPIINEQTRKPAENPVKKTLESGSIVGLANHTVLIAKDGREIPIADSSAPIFNNAGEITGVVLVFRDQTEERATKRELESNYELLHIAGETAKFGAWVVDIENDICIWSDVVADIHEVPRGYSPPVEEAINFYAPEYRGKITEVFRACAEKGTPYDEELEIITQKGNRVWVRTSGRAIRNEAGKITKVHGSFQDVTENVRNKLELKRRAEYEHITANISAELAGLDIEDPDPAINKTLSMLCDFTGSDRVYLFQYKNDFSLVDNTHEYCAEGIKPEIENLKDISLEDELPWLNDLIRKGEMVYIPDVMNMPEEAQAEQKHFESQGIQSVIVLPIKTGENLLGFIGFDAVQQRREWNDDQKSVLRYCSEQLCHVIENLRSNESLRKSEVLLRGIFRNMSTCVAIYKPQADNSDFEFVDMNPAALKNSKFPREEVIGKNVTEVFPGVKESGIFEAFQRVARTGKPEYLETTHYKDERIEQWVENHLFKLPSGLIVAVYEDVTERKSREIGLQRLNERLATAQRVAGLGDWEWDPKTNKVTWSENLYSIMGLPADQPAPDYEGQMRLYHPDDRDIFDKTVTHSLETGEGFSLELRRLLPDGQEIMLESRGRAELDENGQITRLYGTVVDITEQKKMQEQLLQSQKMDAIGQLAGGVAHDFNNLLMGMMNYIELCREELEDGHTVQKWLEEISKDAQRSAKLTQQLLAFSRKQTIAPKILDLNDVVESMLKMLRRLIGEDVELSWKPAATLRPVKMDPGQIDQILVNLCVNARDAIQGAGRISLETSNMSIDEEYCESNSDARVGDYVLLTVSDDGCGMDAKTLSNIYEPFYTTKPQGEGTGLGLATVYGIIRQNEGFINVYSEVGQGTTFRIYLPVSASVAKGQTNSPLEKPIASGSETILVVEDEKAILITTEMFLRKFGYTVLSAPTPAEALSVAAEHKDGIDLLITDVVMPGMSGRELAKKLAKDHTGLKVLYMSGYTADVIAQRGILEDNVELLTKPFSREELGRKVREMLDG